ncbi:Ribosomal RNA processing protein 1-like protein [Armadillidium vulgare]|nr:Ribosomal RNA processing protein 1-like protein [Armadillidium vulgare]
MSPATENLAELRFTQQLGDADVNVRNKAIKRLKPFISFKSSNEGFSYEDFLKIWKGLYYCMYMSDKPLVQEDLAEEISNLIHGVSTNSQKLLFFKASLDTVSREWNGIDKFRYDKFLMLVTRVLRQVLIFMSKISWSRDVLKEFCEILESQIVCPTDDKNVKPLELKMHVSDVILEELAKVGKEKLPDRVLIAVIRPFLKVLAMSGNKTYVLNVINRILHALIKQSKLGIENEEDVTGKEVIVLPRKAKKRLNENKGESDEETEEKDNDFVMDPRIGGVDLKLLLQLESVAHIPEVSREQRKCLLVHAKKFRLLSEGVYPFNFPAVAQHMKQKELSKKSLKRLIEFDEEISAKRSKIIDENDIEDIENYQPEPVMDNRPNKIRKELSKKKEANIKRSKILKNNNKRRRKKINQYKKNPKTLQKFIIKEREEKLRKLEQKLEKQEGKNVKLKQKGEKCSNDVKLKKPCDDPVKSNTEIKTVLQNNSSNNMKKKNKKSKGSVDELKTSNEGKFIQRSAENIGKVKVLKPNKTDKNKKNANIVQNKSKGKSNLQVPEKNLKKDPWKEPLKEGEVEFNVTKKKYSKKVKSGMLMRKTPNVNTKGKTLKINLKNNTEHEFGDYSVALKQSPGIPYSAQKKPLPSVLKSSDSPNLIKKSKKANSRINFIRRRSKF